jgi:hypothetical protein
VSVRPRVIRKSFFMLHEVTEHDHIGSGEVVEDALDIHTTPLAATRRFRSLAARIVGLFLMEETIHVVSETSGVLEDNVAVVFLVVHDANKTNYPHEVNKKDSHMAISLSINHLDQQIKMAESRGRDPQARISSPTLFSKQVPSPTVLLSKMVLMVRIELTLISF